jgi:hypothetical protein
VSLEVSLILDDLFVVVGSCGLLNIVDIGRLRRRKWKLFKDGYISEMRLK